jgi:hypothetical protein
VPSLLSSVDGVCSWSAIRPSLAQDDVETVGEAMKLDGANPLAGGVMEACRSGWRRCLGKESVDHPVVSAEHDTTAPRESGP